ncbi:MAG: hypothetical protein HYS44_02480 [Candidatus Niyogibacteria bacterium]|nr:hypothetical protein [Candidatus Niyogibacteria bacterium]
MTAEAMVKPLVQIAVGAAIIFAITYIAGAFTEPSVLAPNDDPNVARPLHEGTDPQMKNGSLWVADQLIVGDKSTVFSGYRYLQIDAVDVGGGYPPAEDCGGSNGDSELGRMIFNKGAGFVYFCGIDTITNTIQWRKLIPQP